MKTIILIFALVMTSLTFAQEMNLKLLKIYSNKKEFIIKKEAFLDEGQMIEVRDDVSDIPHKATVKTCKQKACLARLEAGIFEMNPKIPGSYKISGTPSKKNSLYLGYGSPLGGAIRLGMRRPINENNSFGIVAGRIQNTLEAADLTGNSVSVQYIYKFLRSSHFELNAIGEAGYAFTLLKFEQAGDKASKKENVYMASLAGEALFPMGDFAAGLNVGYSMNGFGSSYEGNQGVFSNPYAKGLMYVEIGIHYQLD